ncbi:MAG: DUF2069 domain-containing protein [Gammaproteobacteria bacterium]|nr:DUF2069 domain-containing protein [Gammaproteobacteria bacterium]
MSKTQLTYRLGAGSYFALIALLLAWYSWLSPPEVLPVSVVLFLMLVPLLFPLRGILYGRPYTFAWASFLSLFYFTHGVVEAYSNPGDRLLALLEVVLSVGFYTGSMLYARYRGRELKSQAGEELR